MMLLLLFLSGLFIAFVFSLFSGPAPWYAWLLCGLILPVGLLFLAGISFLVELWQSPHKWMPHEQRETSEPPA
jgi:hypothetical protein